MNDNFDLRKFLVESKAIENMNPIFRKLNENTENTTAETKKAINGSSMSPEPVGVSIKCHNQPSKYYAWGHPTNNNTTYANLLDHKKIVPSLNDNFQNLS